MSPSTPIPSAETPASGSPAAANAGESRNARRLMTGVVRSAKMARTITVEVVRTFKHPRYNKYVRQRKRVHAHDERGEAAVGDRVELMSCRPISKLKRWRLVRIVEAAPERGSEIAEAFGDVETVSRAQAEERAARSEARAAGGAANEDHADSEREGGDA